MRYDWEQYVFEWWYYSNKMKGELKMKKSDLRTGMQIVRRDGHKGRVMLGMLTKDIVQLVDLHGAVDGWDPLVYWNKDLTFNHFGGSEKDIVEVGRPTNFCNENRYEVIWTRPVVHTLRLDNDKPVELSGKTYELMKYMLKSE